MLRRLEEFGGEGEPLLFAHANGYPVGSYRQFIDALKAIFHITGFHHRPIWSPEMPPARLNWQRFAEDLIETIEATQVGPVWMMGHSMGATIATLAAARQISQSGYDTRNDTLIRSGSPETPWTSIDPINPYFIYNLRRSWML